MSQWIVCPSRAKPLVALLLRRSEVHCHFTWVCHVVLSWDRWMKSISWNLVSLKSFLILSSYLRLSPSDIYTLYFPTDVLWHDFYMFVMRAACAARLIVHSLITVIIVGEESPFYEMSPVLSVRFRYSEEAVVRFPWFQKSSLYYVLLACNTKMTEFSPHSVFTYLVYYDKPCSKQHWLTHTTF